MSGEDESNEDMSQESGSFAEEGEDEMKSNEDDDESIQAIHPDLAKLSNTKEDKQIDSILEQLKNEE